MTGYNGSREPKAIITPAYRLNSVGVSMPGAWHQDKIFVPSGSNINFGNINQVMVVGTPVTLAATVSGQIPLLMYINARFNHATDILTIRQIGGSNLFQIAGGLTSQLQLSFFPSGLLCGLVQGGIEAVVSAGAAGSVAIINAGWYNALIT